MSRRDNLTEVVPMAKTFLEEIIDINKDSIGTLHQYKIGIDVNKPYITQNIKNQMLELSCDILKIMPNEVKEIYVNDKIDLMNSSIKVRGKRFKGYMRISDEISNRYCDKLQLILGEIENNFEKIIISKY